MTPKDKDIQLIEDMVIELSLLIQRDVPEEGDFPMVYSDLKVTDDWNLKSIGKISCLTDVMLSFRPIPKHLPDHESKRWLELSGYKLPAPYKSVIVLFKGTKEEALRYIDEDGVAYKILRLLPRLDYNLSDV